MGTRPEVAGEAEAAMREWLCAGSLDASEDEIAAAVNSHLGRARMRRVTSIGRAFNLGFDLFSEGSVDAASARTAGLRAVGIEDVARIGGLYFREGPMITVVVQ
jgi:predicted Zn-dependent peptidase